MITQQPLVGTRLNFSHTLFPTGGVWSLNEGGGLKLFDGSGRTNLPGALVNGAVFQQSAKGNSVFFDGTNDYGKITNLDLTGTNQITISVWVKFTSSSSIVLLEHSINFNNNVNTFVLALNTLATGQVYCSTKDVSGYNTVTTTVTAYNDGKWHHVVASLDRQLSGSNQYFIYVDNVLNTTQHATQNFNQSANFTKNDLYIATRGAASLFAAMSITNLMIWKRALSVSEIKQLYVNPYCMYVSKIR